MAKERRDSKNRLLGKGEYQKEDGRYMYRYTDSSGKARFVYSWTLTKTDRTPKGKSPGLCLRDLEKDIEKDLRDGINTYLSNKATVNDYFEKALEHKKNLKPTSRRNYREKYNLYLRDRIGYMVISAVRFTDICNCYSDIVEKTGISLKTLKLVNAVLYPAFNLAVRDNLIRDNPVRGAISEISKSMERNTSEKFALTVDQQKDLLKFINESKVYSKWKSLYIVMLGTGCRVGELCGLTWDDCDFANDIIYIRRTLCYYPEEYSGERKWSIQTPKTSSGIRSIPMFTDVKEALLEEKKKRMRDGFCNSEVDGVCGFVFCNRNLGVLIPNEVYRRTVRMVNSYNKRETTEAKQQNREPKLLPHFSPHILRHTFCTRLCESGVDVKVVQNVMGHASISITMDIYNNVTMAHKQQSFRKIDGVFDMAQSY